MSKRNCPEAMRNRVGLSVGRVVTVSGAVPGRAVGPSAGRPAAW